uniref:Uncharacterized protein n=1 Tax=Avena sativa TaxID=4498 RepID=A0ACD5US76_AVESA
MSSGSLLQRLTRWRPWVLIDEPKQAVKVLVTGAAGQIRYAIVGMIARGLMLWPDQPVVLHMVDLPRARRRPRRRQDGADRRRAASAQRRGGDERRGRSVQGRQRLNVAILICGWPRKEGMKRKDLIAKNVPIYKSQASALQQHAAPNCKVLVVANPANTNALVLKEFTPRIPAKNITCLTRLDHNRALGQVAEKLNVSVGDVRNAIIWAVSETSAFAPRGTWVSMGVFYSFPVTCEKGEWSIVQGLQIDEFARSKMEASGTELKEEKSIAINIL